MFGQINRRHAKVFSWSCFSSLHWASFLTRQGQNNLQDMSSNIQKSYIWAAIYLAELLNIRQISRDLRSSSDLRLDEPIIAQSNFSNRCFEYVAPRLYNSLPVAVRDSSTVLIFKRRLKTFLFNQAYDLNLLCLDKNFRV